MGLAPGARVGSWEVERRLGVGGMGSVWLARHTRLGTPAALKELHSADPNVDRRLRNEGRLQARLAHPNVVRVTDTLELDGRVVLVLEYVDGPTLAAFLAGRPALTVAEIDALGTGILRGAAAAHRLGWVHRDLKPANVLLARVGRGLVPKIADFGIARALHPEEPAFAAGTTTRSGVGTRRYMPFEQLLGHPAEPRMDVFALGAVLFELCEGRPAFPTVEDWEAAVRKGSFPVSARADLPERMRAAITSALCDRRARLPDAGALLARWSGTESRPRAPWGWLAAGVALAVAVGVWVGARSRTEDPLPPLADLHDRSRWTFVDGDHEGLAYRNVEAGFAMFADKRVLLGGEYVPFVPLLWDPATAAVVETLLDGRDYLEIDIRGDRYLIERNDARVQRIRADGTEESFDLALIGVDPKYPSAWESCGPLLWLRLEWAWDDWWALYDTRLPLADPDSWQSFEPSRLDSRAVSYGSPACDDRYMYLPPYFAGDVHMGLAVRYDTRLRFDDPASFTTIDLEALNPLARGYLSAVVAGDAVFYSPWDGMWGSTVARYDRRRPFDDPAAWDFVDLAQWHPEARGTSVVVDGRFVQFTSHDHRAGNPDRVGGVAARFDTAQEWVSAR